MGTSTAYGGPGGGTPLIPSWLGDTDSGSSPATSPGDGAGPDGQPPADGATQPTPPIRPPIPRAADPQRFSGARNNFTRFAGSDGNDRANLGRAVSKYVSTSAGGSRQAAQRMGASRGAGARLLGFLADAQTRGVREALRALNLESLAGAQSLKFSWGWPITSAQVRVRLMKALPARRISKPSLNWRAKGSPI